MSEVIQFDDEASSRNIDDIVWLMRQHQRDYPGGMDWVDKSVEELKLGQKHAMLGRIGTRPAAVCTSQRDPNNPLVVEINHVSQTPEVRGREFAGFCLSQAEYLAPQLFPGAIMFVGNTKEDNAGMLRFAHSHGYMTSSVRILGSQFGHNGKRDVVLVKPMRGLVLPRLSG